jgi:hypothetical protein
LWEHTPLSLKREKETAKTGFFFFVVPGKDFTHVGKYTLVNCFAVKSSLCSFAEQ